MTQGPTKVLPPARQSLRGALTSALATILAARIGSAKQIARATGIAPVTAENIRKGHLSVCTLENILAAPGGQEVFYEIGRQLWGESELDFTARTTAAQIGDLNAALARVNGLRARHQAVAHFGVEPETPEDWAGRDLAGHAHDGSRRVPHPAGLRNEERSWAGAAPLMPHGGARAC